MDAVMNKCFPLAGDMCFEWPVFEHLDLFLPYATLEIAKKIWTKNSFIHQKKEYYSLRNAFTKNIKKATFIRMSFLQQHSRQLYVQGNNRNTKTRCEICSKLTMMSPARRQWRCSDVFIVNFQHILHLPLVFLLLTLST